MNIAFVIPYYGAWGGPAHVIHDVSTMLVAGGHAATVFTTDAGVSGERVIHSDLQEGVQVSTFRNTSRWLARRRGGYLSPLFAAKFKQEVGSFDVVHVVEYRHLLGVSAARHAGLQGVPAVLSPHGSLPNALQRTSLKSVFDRLVGRRLLGRVDHFQAVTQTEAAEMVEAGISSDRISVIPNGVELEHLPSQAEKQQARAVLRLGATDFVLLFMARLHPEKGLMQLLSVVDELKSLRVPVRLLVAGADDGDLANAQHFVLERGLGAAVQFLGFVSGAAKRRAIVASDLFVSLSTYETLPVAVLEALSHDLGVVVSDSAAIAGLEEEGAGLVVSAADTSGAVRILGGLATSSDRRLEMGVAGRALVEREYSLHRVVPRYVEMYSQLIERRV